MSLQLRLHIEIDGASKGNPGPAGVGILISNPDGEVIEEIARPIGVATNNVAEYRALIIGLEECIARGASEVVVQTDSELLSRQVTGRYKVKAEHIIPLFRQVQNLKARFAHFEIGHSLRAGNTRADALANQGAKANR